MWLLFVFIYFYSFGILFKSKRAKRPLTLHWSYIQTHNTIKQNETWISMQLHLKILQNVTYRNHFYNIVTNLSKLTLCSFSLLKIPIDGDKRTLLDRLGYSKRRLFHVTKMYCNKRKKEADHFPKSTPYVRSPLYVRISSFLPEKSFANATHRTPIRFRQLSYC